MFVEALRAGTHPAPPAEEVTGSGPIKVLDTNNFSFSDKP